MSIEHQLFEAYEETTRRLRRPQELDVRIEQMHHQYLFSNEAAARATSRRTWTRGLLITAVLLVIAGFTNSYGLRIGEGVLNIVFNSEPITTYDAKVAKDIRGKLQEIKKGLKIGERILYYSVEFERLFPFGSKKLSMPPFAIITNPYIWSDQEQWINVLNAERVPLRLPEPTPSNLTFAGGQKEGLLGGILTPSNMVLLEELKERTHSLNTSEAWVPLLPNSELNPIYLTIYRTPNREQITITAEIFIDNTQIVSFTDISEHEVIYIDGMKTNYIKTKNYLFSDSDQYQSLVWLESAGDVTVRYEIGTSAIGVSKTDILQIAHLMLVEVTGGSGNEIGED